MYVSRPLATKLCANNNHVQETRTIPHFTHYAIAACEEALQDAGWRPKTDEEQETTVRLPWDDV
jgi:3-oxoacyl-(acyl-carrier-protein) synthase